MKTMTIDSLKAAVSDLPPITDVNMGNMAFELATGDDVQILFGKAIAGPLPMYQVKSLTGRNGIDIKGTTSYLAMANSANEDIRRQGTAMLRRQLNDLNTAIRESNIADRAIVRRYVDYSGRLIVGGIVSNKYVPITHDELIDDILKTPGLSDTQVYKVSATPARLEAMFLLNSEWKTDGGIKAGMMIHNGQFGDRSYGFVSMLFRLLCSNGLMDVLSTESTASRRHADVKIDLAADVASAVDRADQLFGISRSAVQTQVDVVEVLIDLYRREFITKGMFVKAISRINELFDGTGVEGASTTLWGLTQAITAAARDYSLSQMSSMGRLAGRLLINGVTNTLRDRPLGPNAIGLIEARELARLSL
jgi:hypothetical protein